MKKLILFFLVLLPYACFAQIELTLYGGPTVNTIQFNHTNSNPNFSTRDSTTVQFAVGMRAAYEHTDNLSFESGLRLTRKHYSTYVKRVFSPQLYYIVFNPNRLTSWEVPLTAVYRLPLYSIGRDIYLRAGLTVNFNQFRTTNKKGGIGIGGSLGDFNYIDSLSATFTNTYKPRRITSGAEVGISIKPLVWDILELGLLFHYDFQPVNREVAYTIYSEVYDNNIFKTERASGTIQPVRSFYFMLQLGYTFNAKKSDF